MDRGGCKGFVATAVMGAALGLLGCGGSTAGGPDAGPIEGEPSPDDNGGLKISDPAVSLPATLEIAEGLAISVPASGTWTSYKEYAFPDPTQTISLQGELQVVTPSYTFTLGKAALKITRKKDVVQTVSGTAKVLMPALHTFSGLGLAGSVLSASFGYQKGANLGALGLPLAPDRKYLYYTFSEGFNASFGTGAFTAAANTMKTNTVVVDPLDPAIFIAGPMGDLEAVALSERSLIPFTAETTWGFDMPGAEFPSFGGQSFIAGNVPLEEFPIVVNGNVTTKFVGWDGQSALDKTLFSKAIGVNGYFNLGWQALDGTLSFEIPVAQASLYIESSAHPYSAAAAFSGTATSLSYLPPWLPVELTERAQLAAYMDTADPAKNHLDGAGALTVQASTVGKLIGLDMKDLSMAEATFHVDRVGFRFNGKAKLQVPPHLTLAEAKITACFGGDAKACLDADHSAQPVMGSQDWIIRGEGSATVAGVPIASLTTMAGPKGLTLEGTFKTQAQQVSMTGSVQTGGSVHLGGDAVVDFSLNAGNEVLNAIVSGAACGYKVVTDAVTCGTQTLDFTDVFHCGKPHCSWSWKHGLRCSSVSCRVTVAKTCKDLAKPKKCVPKNQNNFDLGRVQGKVALTIKNDGIGGELSGTFCHAGGGSCVSLANVGKLDFSSVTAPELCIDAHEISSTLPLGKFCVEF